MNTWAVMSLRALLLLLLLAVSSCSSITQSGQTYASVLFSNSAKRWMRTFLRLGMIAPGAIFSNLPRTSGYRRQGTFIDDNDPNKGLQHLGNEPNTLIALVMHDGLVVTTGRTLSGAGAGAPRPLPSSFPPRSAQYALEADVAVVVRQVRQHARADDAVNVCPIKLNAWRMSSARTSVGTSVAGVGE